MAGDSSAPRHLEDAVLIAQVVEHDDRAAFATLVRRHQGAIQTLLRRLTGGDRAAAEDLAQVTFLSAYRALASFRGAAQFRTWLYRIACNECFQRQRLLRASRETAWTEASAADDAAAPPAYLGAGDLALDLERALMTLSAAERDAVLACYYAEFSHSEAAELLGCPIGTVKTNVLRARAKLAALLAAWAPASAESH